MVNLKKLTTRIRQSQNEEGQGLVEYALILVLVAIVVIAVMLLLGPVVGNVFSNVVANLSITEVEGAAPSADPPPPPANWTFCADENELCSFSGTKQVRYGNSPYYDYENHTDGVMCSNAAFGGDPYPNVVKSCYYR